MYAAHVCIKEDTLDHTQDYKHEKTYPPHACNFVRSNFGNEKYPKKW